MEITEVRIKLMDTGEDRLRGFCSVTFDNSFVVRDLKIIEGNNGPFVAMPSRKLTANCRKCGTKNHLRSNYCNSCGNRVDSEKLTQDSGGRTKLYADIAHPVNAECREKIQSRIIEELENELKLAQEPGYTSLYDDGYDAKPRPASNADSDDSTSAATEPAAEPAPPAPAAEIVTRIDAGQPDPVRQPHKNPSPDNQNTSPGRSKPSNEEFGKGIFD